MWQPKVKTVQGMVDKTIGFMFPDFAFKTFGTGRTDAKVSANQFVFQLQIDCELSSNFIKQFNANLPSDIRGISFNTVENDWNPLKNSDLKYYLYLFAFGEKAHPFSAAMVYTDSENLDIKLMQQGAKLFEGCHDFRKYCTKPGEQTKFKRTITHCEINTNVPHTASFFPKRLFALHIKSKGFMRYQVRLIMGQLLALGRGDINIDDVKNSLTPTDNTPLRYNAVGSGLILQGIEINSSQKKIV